MSKLFWSPTFKVATFDTCFVQTERVRSYLRLLFLSHMIWAAGSLLNSLFFFSFTSFFFLLVIRDRTPILPINKIIFSPFFCQQSYGKLKLLSVSSLKVQSPRQSSGPKSFWMKSLKNIIATAQHIKTDQDQKQSRISSIRWIIISNILLAISADDFNRQNS